MGIKIQTSDYMKALQIQMEQPPAGVHVSFQPSVIRQRGGFESVATFLLEIEKSVPPADVSAWLCHGLVEGRSRTITIGPEEVPLVESEVSRAVREQMRLETRPPAAR